MTNATATEPLADVQEGDWAINEYPHQCATIIQPIRHCFQVTRRTKRRVWIGGEQYRLSGKPVDQWSRNYLRLPKPGEVEELQAKDRAKAEARAETGKQYSRKRERYIALIYASAQTGDWDAFLDMLCHWESGTWDDDLDRIDAAKQPEG